MNNNKMKKRKRKFIIMCIFIISIICTGIVIYNFLQIKKEEALQVKISKNSIKEYIDLVDEKSKDKVQLNWKEIYSIAGAIKNNVFESVDEKDAKEIADRFFIEKNIDGKKIIGIKSMDEVIKEMNLEEKIALRAKANYKKFQTVGLVPNNLDKNSQNKLFIEEIKDEANNIYSNYGILPSILIAQAALETGWGKSELSSKSNNLFGIKADKSWKGPKVKMKTNENFKDVIYDDFRAYSSRNESIKDYGEFLKNNKRYRKNGVFEAKNYKDQAIAIENAGYSTKSDKEGNLLYSTLLTNIIRDNDLQLLDYNVIKEKNNKLLNR
ncbi:Flagellum-specific peptidoglycan hydrolase FlgJ [Clostridium cavendishii DSM 21758]|uniref:Flagellum-specific peptidoglycan hydrolase FlgJ n=1 Tax=Clostridium cavendishii DSM 21758 TaxID=1121302 RepID=A0A1M6AHV2_9CLOT|nr:glucosaminidase domain-containing protein [Clostridium cavendishii]SHI35971.1 Flagellum-specific peptidoglycan hydrolase FlgJ [Clostridium cavendishii DSM 21758]